MNNVKLIVIVFFMALLSYYCNAADRADTSETSDIEYDIMPDDSYDHNDYFYKLHHYREERVNINTCTLQKLLSIPVVSFATASAIITYRGKNEKYFSLQELFMVENADSAEITTLLPYLRTGFEPDSRKFEKRSSSSPLKISLITRAINSSQMDDVYGRGLKALKTYSSLHAEYGDSLSMGVCTEKDAGEKNLTDYKSFYFRANNIFGTDYILLGDYSTEFGKGLLVWAPFRQINTMNASNPQMGFGTGVREHSGTSESLFMRGAAIGLHYDYLRFECFFSHRSIDASFDSTGAYISYISLSGYHRSKLEIARQSAATENLAGSIITFTNYRSYELKLLLMYDSYSVPFAQKLGIPQSKLNGSFSYAFAGKSLSVNGEYGSNNNKYGLLTNIKIIPVETTSMTISYRNYAPSFLGLHSSAFSRNSETTAGEEGLYSGIRIGYKKLLCNLYADYFRTIQPDKFGICYHGTEYVGSLAYAGTKKIEHKFGLKYSINEYARKGYFYITASTYSHLLTWYDLEYNATNNFTIKSRVGISRIKDTTQHRGFVSYIQAKLHLSTATSVCGRAYFYNSDDYDSGFYVAEGEVPGYVTTSHLYNDGSRYFIAITTTLLNHLSLSLKATGQTSRMSDLNIYFAQYSLQCALRY